MPIINVGNREYLKKNFNIRFYTSGLLVLVSLVFLWSIILTNPSKNFWLVMKNPYFLVIELIILLIIIFSDHISKIAEKYYRAIASEEKIASVLDNLPQEYTTLVDIKAPNLESNIDFIVFGPTGVFTIEAKSIGEN